MKYANGEQPQRLECSEAMSRLIDGELDASECRELLQRLASDDEARRIWTLLNVACDAVRSNETAALHSAGFVTRVSAALADEPVILAPGAARRRPGMIRRVVLPTAAVAAAAAVLVVVAVPQLRGGADPTSETKIVRSEAKGSTPKIADAKSDVVRSAAFEAYLEAHRESASGPISWRANEYVTNVNMTTESR